MAADHHVDARGLCGPGFLKNPLPWSPVGTRSRVGLMPDTPRSALRTPSLLEGVRLGALLPERLVLSHLPDDGTDLHQDRGRGRPGGGLSFQRLLDGLVGNAPGLQKAAAH